MPCIRKGPDRAKDAKKRKIAGGRFLGSLILDSLAGFLLEGRRTELFREKKTRPRKGPSQQKNAPENARGK